MKNILILVSTLLLVSSCGGSKEFDPQSIKGKTIGFAIHNNANLINKGYYNSEYAKTGLIGLLIEELREEKAIPEKENIDVKYNIPNPTESIGTYAYNLMSERFDLEKGDKTYSIKRMKSIKNFASDVDEVDYLLVASTPYWHFRTSNWSNNSIIMYAFQYYLHDTKSGDRISADACDFESDKSYSLEEIKENDFAVLRKEMSEAEEYCKNDIEKNIDPNRIMTFKRKLVYK